jgi:hypothetical protein
MHVRAHTHTFAHACAHTHAHTGQKGAGAQKDQLFSAPTFTPESQERDEGDTEVG